MKQRNSWKRICFKMQQNLSPTSLTNFNTKEGAWNRFSPLTPPAPFIKAGLIHSPQTRQGINDTVGELTEGSDPSPTPLPLGATVYTHLLSNLLHTTFRPPSPPILGGTGTSKSPRIGGFRGQDHLRHKPEDLCVHRSLLGEGLSGSPFPCFRSGWGGSNGLKTRPSPQPHNVGIAISLLLLSANLTALTQPLAAEPLAQSLPVLTPTQPAAVEALNKGIGLVQQGKLPEAIAAFRQASQLNPQLASAHYNLGLALRQAGQLQASADAFYQATQVDPNFALAFANLGAALLEGNNLQQARDYLTRALELEPNLGVAHYNYGLLLSQSGQLEQAIAQFKSAMQLSQNAPEPAYHIGLIYLQQGKIEEAKNLFQQALKINPKYPEAHYNLGSILFNQGNLDGALQAFRKSAESNSNYANAYYGAGLVFLRQNRLSDAQQVLQYAKALYTAQGNSQWAVNAEQLLQRSQNAQP